MTNSVPLLRRWRAQALAGVLLTLLLCPMTALAQSVTILHSFGDGTVANDGIGPESPLVLGSDGNFYGTTEGGGSAQWGTIFKMTPAGALTILHSFGDGSVPNDGNGGFSTLAEGPDGNYYGECENGGKDYSGTLYKITSAGKMTLLHTFHDGTIAKDGQYPVGSLVWDPAKQLFYGVTIGGGMAGAGTVFTLSLGGAVAIIHNFEDGSTANDGSSPGGIMLASGGNFYGVTESGGAYPIAGQLYGGWGTVFSMTSSGIVTILHSFDGNGDPGDGYSPGFGVAEGLDGLLYGITVGGGAAGQGTVFKIDRTSGNLTTLHSWQDGTVANDGSDPWGPLIVGRDGNLYGLTGKGGIAENGGYGTAYSITPTGQVTILHSFLDGSVARDGLGPGFGLVEGKSGLFYGVAEAGGSAYDGVVFSLNVTYSFTVAPNPLIGGRSARGTITLASPVAARTKILLTSSDPSTLAVPASLILSQGASKVSFTIKSTPVDSNEDVLLTAQAPGGPLESVVTVEAPTLVSNAITIDTNPIAGGNTTMAHVALSGPAPAGGFTVALSVQNNQYGAVQGLWSALPGTPGAVKITSVTIPAGATSADFAIQTKPVATSVTATIRGTANGVSRGTAFTVLQPGA